VLNLPTLAFDVTLAEGRAGAYFSNGVGVGDLYYWFVLFSAIPEMSIMYGDVKCLNLLTASVTPVHIF